MRVKVLYFAALREQRGVADEWLDVTAETTLQELYSQLFPAGPGGALPVAFTRNEVISSGGDRILDGDTVCFLPPLGGG